MSRKVTIAGARPTSIKRLLSAAGMVCPVYRPEVEDAGSETASEKWLSDSDGDDPEPVMPQVAEELIYRKYHDENDADEDGRGNFPEDQAVLTALADADMQVGDYIEYRDDRYELTAKTVYGPVTEWRVNLDREGTG